MRTLEEIRMTGAAWITETELAALLDALDAMREFVADGSNPTSQSYAQMMDALADSNWCERP